jgi:F-type H+-transporting ATPase subunit a
MGFISHNILLAAAFLPAGTPFPLTFLMIIIEVIAYTTRTLSLGLRLAVNMITGHILVKVVLGFVYEALLSGTSLLILSIPLLFLTAFLALELLIAY